MIRACALPSHFPLPLPALPTACRNGNREVRVPDRPAVPACATRRTLASITFSSSAPAEHSPVPAARSECRRAQRRSRMAGTLTSPLAPALPGHSLTAASTTAPSRGTGTADHTRAPGPSIAVPASPPKNVIVLTCTSRPCSKRRGVVQWDDEKSGIRFKTRDYGGAGRYHGGSRRFERTGTRRSHCLTEAGRR
jgi:hypothetical protein